MKERKLLLVGPPDSGKTSWFAPFQGAYYIYLISLRLCCPGKICSSYLIVLLECYNWWLFSFSCDFKYLLTNLGYFSNNSSKQGINSLCKC